MVRQDGEAFLRKRRAQDVAQKAGSGVVVEGTRVGLGVQVETAVLHDQVANDLRRATRGDGYGLALALGGARGRQPGNGGCRQLRQHRVPRREGVVHLQVLGTDPHHPAALECLQHAYLRDLNHIGHLVRLQATKCTEDRPAVSPGDIETVQRDNV